MINHEGFLYACESDYDGREGEYTINRRKIGTMMNSILLLVKWLENMSVFLQRLYVSNLNKDKDSLEWRLRKTKLHDKIFL